jgi:hypothetical protein
MKIANLALVIGIGLTVSGGVVWRHRSHPAPVPGVLERAAAARFKNTVPHIVMPDGARYTPSNDQENRALKLELFKAALARDAERRDPGLHARAEDEVRARAPMSVSVEWEDPSGARSLEFVALDTRGCGLEPGESKVGAGEFFQFGCLVRGGTQNRWPDDARLTIRAVPMSTQDRGWPGLVRDRVKQLAAEAYVDRGG